MSFTFTDQHVTDYYQNAYVILKGILPPALIEDLRAAGEELHQITIRDRGPNAARSSVISKVAESLSPRGLQAFKDYCELPALNDAIPRLLTPEHRINGLDNLAVFFIYPKEPNCQDWHRDIDEGYVGITEPADRAEFIRNKQDPNFFTQVNCPLFTDTCLWYVPASAGRRNTKGELLAAGEPYNGIEGRGRMIDALVEGKSYAEQERICLEYCRGMPGALNVVLEAGDLCLYRPLGWHTGNYAPHRKRMTLHHNVGTDSSRDWLKSWMGRITEASK